MNVHQLFDAIGQASPEYVSHSERTISRVRQSAVRVGLIAAVLAAVMSITVAASPAVRAWLFGIRDLNEKQTARPVAIESEGFGIFSGGMLEIRPTVDLREDYPRSIETFYVPMLLVESWTPGIIYTDNPAGFLESLREQSILYWDDLTSDTPRSVRFCQYTGRYLDLGTPLTWLDIGYNRPEDCVIEAVELAGIPMQRVCVPDSEVVLEHGSAHFGGADSYFWTDGSYLFSLSVPSETETALIEAIVTSLAPTDDLTPYLDLRAEQGEAVQNPPLTRHFAPTFVPEGWTLYDAWEEVGYFSRLWIWEQDKSSTLHFLQTSDPDQDAMIEAGWQSGMEDYTKSSVPIGETTATVYAAAGRVELVLPFGDGFVVLRSNGPGAASVDELIQIAESLELVE